MGAPSVWAILTLESHMANQHYYIGETKFYVTVGTKFLMKLYVERQWGNGGKEKGAETFPKEHGEVCVKEFGA